MTTREFFIALQSLLVGFAIGGIVCNIIWHRKIKRKIANKINLNQRYGSFGDKS